MIPWVRCHTFKTEPTIFLRPSSFILIRQVGQTISVLKCIALHITRVIVFGTENTLHLIALYGRMIVSGKIQGTR